MSYTTVSVKKDVLEKLSALAGAFREDKAIIVADLVEALFLEWQNQIKRELASKGQISGVYVYDIPHGKIVVASKPKVVSKTVKMNEKSPSVKEIEKNCFGD